MFTTDAPFVPVPEHVRKKVVEELNLNNDAVLYDLGCGDARVLVDAVTAHTHITAIGVEKAFFPYLLARWNTRMFKNVRIIRGDIFTVPISDATHVFCYLYPQVIQKLAPRIEHECTQPVRMVSCDFALTQYTPEHVVDIEHTNSSRGKKIFVYVFKQKR
jgi:16S rRNA A1518/A1519 N6-dimethyltransferase RsmA/KsgA/DIM1 with predicted DNA glycosylase/AP lyase activity